MKIMEGKINAQIMLGNYIGVEGNNKSKIGAVFH
jgi:hypothetical protein